MQLIVRGGFVLALTLVVACAGFSQVQAVQTVQPVQAPNRIPQQIIVNSQQVNGAYVSSPNGGMQSFTCPGPQEYVTPDGASRGWACFDSTTGVWLLNSLPPAQMAPQYAPQPVPQQTVIYQPAPPTATVVYTQPATVVYTEPMRTVVYRPYYSPSVVIGAAVIRAAGRVASAAIIGSRHDRYYDSRTVVYDSRGRGRRR